MVEHLILKGPGHLNTFENQRQLIIFKYLAPRGLAPKTLTLRLYEKPFLRKEMSYKLSLMW